MSGVITAHHGLAERRGGWAFDARNKAKTAHSPTLETLAELESRLGCGPALELRAWVEAHPHGVEIRITRTSASR